MKKAVEQTMNRAVSAAYYLVLAGVVLLVAMVIGSGVAP